MHDIFVRLEPVNGLLLEHAGEVAGVNPQERADFWKGI
jgi:hypothetical protein